MSSECLVQLSLAVVMEQGQIGAGALNLVVFLGVDSLHYRTSSNLKMLPSMDTSCDWSTPHSSSRSPQLLELISASSLSSPLSLKLSLVAPSLSRCPPLEEAGAGERDAAW